MPKQQFKSVYPEFEDRSWFRGNYENVIGDAGSLPLWVIDCDTVQYMNDLVPHISNINALLYLKDSDYSEIDRSIKMIIRFNGDFYAYINMVLPAVKGGVVVGRNVNIFMSLCMPEIDETSKDLILTFLANEGIVDFIHPEVIINISNDVNKYMKENANNSVWISKNSKSYEAFRRSFCTRFINPNLYNIIEVEAKYNRALLSYEEFKHFISV